MSLVCLSVSISLAVVNSITVAGVCHCHGEDRDLPAKDVASISLLIKHLEV